MSPMDDKTSLALLIVDFIDHKVKFSLTLNFSETFLFHALSLPLFN